MSTSFISLLSGILVSISAIVVAVVAFYGLRTWRKELTGKAKFEVARNLMLLGFKFKDAFQWATNPFTSSGEHAARQRQENESPNVSMVLDEWYARDRRLVTLHEYLGKIQESGWEAEVLLGEDVAKPITEAIKVFINAYAELSSAISSYFDTRREEVSRNYLYKDQDWLMKLHKMIYSASKDDINISKQIVQATEQLASALRQYVR
jgi:hypothetical protein